MYNTLDGNHWGLFLKRVIGMKWHIVEQMWLFFKAVSVMLRFVLNSKGTKVHEQWGHAV